jgi:hypothetical protein
MGMAHVHWGRFFPAVWIPKNGLWRVWVFTYLLHLLCFLPCPFHKQEFATTVTVGQGTAIFSRHYGTF